MVGLGSTLFVLLLIGLGVFVAWAGIEGYFNDAKEEKRLAEEQEAREEQQRLEDLKQQRIDAIRNTPPEMPEPPLAFVREHTGMALMSRNEHHLIAGTSGSGKSTFAKYLILEDVPFLQRRECSVVVIDVKGDLIDDLLDMKEVCDLDPIVIDPRDVGHPFNLGFIDFDYIRSLPPLERQVAYAQSETMLITALGAEDDEMSVKMEGMFRYIFKLMAEIPGATAKTLDDILHDKVFSVEQSQYYEYIQRLDEIDQNFFRNMFYVKHGEYTHTRDHVGRRLAGILSNPVMRQAFTSTGSAFDFKAALDKGSLILVNASGKVLGGQGDDLGRFIIARLFQAVEAREGRLKDKLTVVYADEAQQYLDESAERIFERGRSANVGLVAIMPSFEKLKSISLRNLVIQGTRIKTIGNMSRSYGRMVMDAVTHQVDVEEIANLRKGEFLTFSSDLLSYETHEPELDEYIRTYEFERNRKTPTEHLIYAPEQATWIPGYHEQKHVHFNKVSHEYLDEVVTPSTQEDRTRVRDLNRRLYSVQPTNEVETTAEPVPGEMKIMEITDRDGNPVKVKTRRKPRRSKKPPKDDPTKAEPFDL